MATVGPARTRWTDVSVEEVSPDGRVTFRCGDDYLSAPVDEFDRWYVPVVTTTAEVGADLS